MPNNKPSTLHRVVWRWHFYAGIIIAPIILVVALTGGIYIFKSEVEWLRNASVLTVTPSKHKLPFDEQAVAAQRTLPDGYAPAGIEVPSIANKATVLLFIAPKQAAHRVCVDPYTGRVLGELSPDKFFPWILQLHRNLFLGATGRVIVELGTSWAIVLVLTGIYLWLPKRKTQVKGVWFPRLRSKPYTVLRDLHTVAGFYAMPVILVMCLSGLLYSYVWGRSYRYASQQTGASKFFGSAPKSPGAGDALASLDEFVKTARSKYPYQPLSIFLPRRAGDSVTLFARGDFGPSNHGYMVLHRSDASILLNKPVTEFPAATQWATWNLALHVGTIGGIATKWLWLLACIVLAGLPVSGLWMWMVRRPAGRVGLPRRTTGYPPRWVLGVAGSLMLFLPVFGLSLVAVLFCDCAAQFLLYGRAKEQAAQAA